MKQPSNKNIEALASGLSKGAREDMIPKMMASAFVAVLLDKDPDLYLALQVGMALLLDKPLLILAPEGVWVPPRLRTLAEGVIVGNPRDPEAQEKLQDALAALLKAKPQ